MSGRVILKSRGSYTAHRYTPGCLQRGVGSSKKAWHHGVGEADHCGTSWKSADTHSDKFDMGRAGEVYIAAGSHDSNAMPCVYLLPCISVRLHVRCLTGCQCRACRNAPNRMKAFQPGILKFSEVNTLGLAASQVKLVQSATDFA